MSQDRGFVLVGTLLVCIFLIAIIFFVLHSLNIHGGVVREERMRANLDQYEVGGQYPLISLKNVVQADALLTSIGPELGGTLILTLPAGVTNVEVIRTFQPEHFGRNGVLVAAHYISCNFLLEFDFNDAHESQLWQECMTTEDGTIFIETDIRWQVSTTQS